MLLILLNQFCPLKGMESVVNTDFFPTLKRNLRKKDYKINQKNKRVMIQKTP